MSFFMNKNNEMSINFILYTAVTLLNSLLMVSFQIIASQKVISSLFRSHFSSGLSKSINNWVGLKYTRINIKHGMHDSNCTTSISSILSHEINTIMNLLILLFFFLVIFNCIFTNGIQENNCQTWLRNHFLSPLFNGK